MLTPWHIQSRSQFIEEAHALCPSRAAQRAIREGRIVLLGGFSDIPPLGRPGFICRVLSRHGRTWYLALIAELDRSFRGVFIEGIPWENRVGKTVRIERWTMNDGDPPPPASEMSEEGLAKIRAAAKATRFLPPPRFPPPRTPSKGEK